MSRLNMDVFGDAADKPIPQEVWDKIEKKQKERVPHKDFIEVAKVFASLPAKTQRALGPESDEDISMYSEDKQ